MLEPALALSLAESRRRIVITGASGWIGQATLELLEQALGDQFHERVACFGSSARTLTLRSGLRVDQQPLAAIGDLPARPSWVLHFAFLTKDRAEDMAEADYRAANRSIGETVLGALDAIGTEAVFVASSGAAKYAHDASASAAMRLYGAMKADDEERFAAWAAARGRRAVIGRIFNITGPYMNKLGSYALANFILDGIAGCPIEVRAPRPVIRSYVAIRELMSLVFSLMEAGPDGVIRFDSGGEPLELAEVAQAVAAAFPGTSVKRAAITEDHADRYHGDCAAYSALLRSAGLPHVPLAAQIGEAVAYLRTVQPVPGA